jgi:hypothetical protein
MQPGNNQVHQMKKEEDGTPTIFIVQGIILIVYS